MKKTVLPLILFLFASACFVKAQMVSETVDFDTYISTSDNDFQNRFDNGPGLNQLQANGITGGCLETPHTENWGNDNAIYCTHFKGQIGVSYITGICFKYDTMQLNSINFDRAVTLWMKPYTDPNHYIIASVLGTGNVQIVSYSAAASSAVLALQQDHWYNLLLITDFAGGAFSDQININAQVNDLGLSGQDPPFPTGFTNAVLHDSILIADADIEVSVSGTSWGGALYLDNFRFDGMKSYDNCVSTEVNENGKEKSFSFSVINNTLSILSSPAFGNSEMEILNLNGQKLKIEKINSGISKYDLSSLPNGFYFLRVTNEKTGNSKKFVLIR